MGNRTPCGRVKKPLLPQAELYATDPWYSREELNLSSAGYQPAALPLSYTSIVLVSRCGVDPLPRRDGFYRPAGAASAFPCPCWSPRRGSNPALSLTKAAHRPSMLHGQSGGAAGTRIPRRGCRRHPLSRRCRAPARLRAPYLGGRPTCRSPHLAVPSRFERAPGAVPVDLPDLARRPMTQGAFKPRVVRAVPLLGGRRVHSKPTPRRAPSRFKRAPAPWPVHLPSWRRAAVLIRRPSSGPTRFPSGAQLLLRSLPKPWYPRRDSNSHRPAPKAGASTNWATRANWGPVWVLTPYLQVESLVSRTARRTGQSWKRVHGVEPAAADLKRPPARRGPRRRHGSG